MTDWKGNIFEPGDILVAVLIKPPERQTAPLVYDPATNTLHPAAVTINTGPEWIWMPYLETEVYACPQTGETLMLIMNYETGETLGVPIEFAEMHKGRFVHFCKRGVSDNEEEFFNNYFQHCLN